MYNNFQIETVVHCNVINHRIRPAGYYQVNYDEKNWKMLIQTLNNPEHFQMIGKYIPLNRVTRVSSATFGCRQLTVDKKLVAMAWRLHNYTNYVYTSNTRVATLDMVVFARYPSNYILQ